MEGSAHGGAPAGGATMRSLEMSGAYRLTGAGIDATLARAGPGNYALGYMEDGAFVVFYVGRSDSDLRQRLHEWVGRPSPGGPAERYGSPAKAPWRAHRTGLFPVEAPSRGRVESGESPYTHFAFSQASSTEAAYAQEWRNYDAFGGPGLDNEHEPESELGP